MAALQITSENQIHRINMILHQVRDLHSHDLKYLSTKPNQKSWNILEVIKHLNIAYSFYENKINDALSKSPAIDGDSKSFKVRPWQAFVIKGQKPKNGIRKWKMKTFKRFEPILSKEDITSPKVNELFENFDQTHGHLKSSILESRQKDTSKVKFSSAIGAIVSFYLPEAFEFLISHAERHMLQIQKIQMELNHSRT